MPSIASTDPSHTIATARATTVSRSWITLPGWLRDTRQPSGW